MKSYRLAALVTTVLTSAILSAQVAATADSSGIASHRFDAALDDIYDHVDPPAAPLAETPLAGDEVFAAAALRAAVSPLPDGAGVDGLPIDLRDDMAAIESSGKSKAPYTTSRVAVSRLGKARKAAAIPVTSAPYRATGKLLAKFGGKTVACTASLIRRGVLLTAAHCVARFDEGDAGFAESAMWYPAQWGKKKKQKPWGGFKARNVFVPIVYLEGEDTCTMPGVVCNNNVATVVVGKKKVTNKNGKKVRKFAGQILGTYSYGFNAYGFRKSAALGGGKVAQVTQLGYPVGFDKGVQMQRTDAVSWYFQDGDLKNFQMGSPQRAGSDGSPWIVNFGTKPKVNKKKAFLGAKSKQNVIVAVTGYAAKNKKTNLIGASYLGRNKEFPKKNYGDFGPGNIGALLEATCRNYGKFC